MQEVKEISIKPRPMTQLLGQVLTSTLMIPNTALFAKILSSTLIIATMQKKTDLKLEHLEALRKDGTQISLSSPYQDQGTTTQS